MADIDRVFDTRSAVFERSNCEGANQTMRDVAPLYCCSTLTNMEVAILRGKFAQAYKACDKHPQLQDAIIAIAGKHHTVIS